MDCGGKLQARHRFGGLGGSHAIHPTSQEDRCTKMSDSLEHLSKQQPFRRSTLCSKAVPRLKLATAVQDRVFCSRHHSVLIVSFQSVSCNQPRPAFPPCHFGQSSSNEAPPALLVRVHRGYCFPVSGSGSRGRRQQPLCAGQSRSMVRCPLRCEKARS